MWSYEKRLQFPVKIKTPNAAAAKVIITQYGGPDGELGASMRYLSQRYTMPWRGVAGLLTDIGTEELAHLEMVSAIVYQLTKGLSADEIKRQGFDTYFVDHTAGVWPQAAGGTPFTSVCFASKGDAMAYARILRLDWQMYMGGGGETLVPLTFSEMRITPTATFIGSQYAYNCTQIRFMLSKYGGAVTLNVVAAGVTAYQVNILLSADL